MISDARLLELIDNAENDVECGCDDTAEALRDYMKLRSAVLGFNSDKLHQCSMNMKSGRCKPYMGRKEPVACPDCPLEDRIE